MDQQLLASDDFTVFMINGRLAHLGPESRPIAGAQNQLEGYPHPLQGHSGCCSGCFQLSFSLYPSFFLLLPSAPQGMSPMLLGLGTCFQETHPAAPQKSTLPRFL